MIQSKKVHTIINHPVHIIDEQGSMSPSAFIPFCEFGGNMSVMGVRNGHFNVTTCNSFQAKMIHDQLCYEVDLNRFSNMNNIEKELNAGFAFIMDYNEDRHIAYEEFSENNTDMSFVSRIDKSDDNLHAFIYLNTIGISCV